MVLCECTFNNICVIYQVDGGIKGTTDESQWVNYPWELW